MLFYGERDLLQVDGFLKIQIIYDRLTCVVVYLGFPPRIPGVFDVVFSLAVEIFIFETFKKSILKVTFREVAKQA